MDTKTPLATVQHYVNAFNEGNATKMAACFAPVGQILDGLSPHVWQGPTAALDWYRDVLAEGKAHGASNYVVGLGSPLHNNETGDAAYVVIPATMSFDLKGVRVNQKDAVFTIALRKIENGWRITAWAWAKGRNEG